MNLKVFLIWNGWKKILKLRNTLYLPIYCCSNQEDVIDEEKKVYLVHSSVGLRHGAGISWQGPCTAACVAEKQHRSRYVWEGGYIV